VGYRRLPASKPPLNKPALRQTNPTRLRLKGIQALLQLAPADARALAAKEPGLLTFRLAELRGRMDYLIERLKVRGTGLGNALLCFFQLALDISA
jgi:hypothetical protein